MNNITKERVLAAISNAVEGAKRRPPPSQAELWEALFVGAQLIDKIAEEFGDIAQADENSRLLMAAATGCDLNLKNVQLLDALSMAGAVLIEYADVHTADKDAAQAARWRDDVLVCYQLLAEHIGAGLAQ